MELEVLEGVGQVGPLGRGVEGHRRRHLHRIATDQSAQSKCKTEPSDLYKTQPAEQFDWVAQKINDNQNNCAGKKTLHRFH